MKKILILVTILSLCLPTFAEHMYSSEYSKAVENFDNYEQIPTDLINDYIKTIPDSEKEKYQFDMNIALKHILYDKITYNNKTLSQMLVDFDKETTTIYKKYLKNKNNKIKNKIYINKLQKMQGTISLYPDAIIEEIKPTIDKYDLGIAPGAESDILLYKYYIEKYNIALAQEFKNLLIMKQIIFQKVNNCISEISNNI